MKYCFHCGNELNQELAFCPYCGGALGREATVREAHPVTKKMDGGTRGKGIASIALGAGALFLDVYALFFFLFEFVFTLILFEEDIPFGAVFSIYVLVFSFIAVGCSIAGKLLGDKALEKAPGYKLAKIGRVLSLAGIIASGAVASLSILMLLVWL